MRQTPSHDGWPPVIHFFHWWERLTAPSGQLSPGDRKQAQFLSSLLLFLLTTSLLLCALGLALSAPEAHQTLLAGTAVIVLFLLPFYFLSRTAHHQLAALLVSYTFSAVILLSALTIAAPPLLATLILPLLLASVLLSLRATSILVTATLLALVLATAFNVGGQSAMLVRAVFFYALSAGTLLLIAHQQRLVRREQETELRDSEMRFRALSEKALVGIYVLQDDLFRYVNPTMAAIFGYTPDEIIDKLDLLDLTHPQQHAELLQHLQARMRGEQEETQIELQGLGKGAQQIACELYARPMEYYGRPALIGMAFDVTHRRQIDQADQEQRALLEALRDSAAALNSTLDLDQILSRILDNVGRVVPHDGANIMLLDGNTVRLVRCQGYYEVLGEVDYLMSITHDVRDAPNLRHMVETGAPSVIADTRLHPGWYETEGSEWIRSYVGAPISRGGEVIGFLNLDSRQPGFFNEAHGERLMAFAEQVAIAMKNARLFHDLESYSESLEQAVASRTVELRRTTEQVEVILNNSPDAVLLLRNDGAVRMANPAFYEMFGYQEHELLHQPLPSLVAHTDEARFLAALDSVLKRGKRARLELLARRKNGSTFDADVALAPVVDDGVVRGGVCSLHDISRLKEVDRMKDAFVSNVSHELRTPITSLRLYHDLLLRNPARREIYLQRQEREIERLNTIIEDLLRLSRLDRGQTDISWQELTLNDLVEEYVLDRRPLAADMGVQLLWEPAPQSLVVRADRGLLEQVIGIMLTNALNYTAPNSSVTISTAVHPRNGSDWATCTVSDNGPGIDDQEYPLLFERFFRGAAAQQSRTPGTGLGLAIAREIVERHEGYIEACNKEGDESGAVFTIWLPLVAIGEPQNS